MLSDLIALDFKGEDDIIANSAMKTKRSRVWIRATRGHQVHKSHQGYQWYQCHRGYQVHSGYQGHQAHQPPGTPGNQGYQATRATWTIRATCKHFNCRMPVHKFPLDFLPYVTHNALTLRAFSTWTFLTHVGSWFEAISGHRAIYPSEEELREGVKNPSHGKVR